jgi:hypothetical protein
LTYYIKIAKQTCEVSARWCPENDVNSSCSKSHHFAYNSATRLLSLSHSALVPQSTLQSPRYLRTKPPTTSWTSLQIPIHIIPATFWVNCIVVAEATSRRQVEQGSRTQEQPGCGSRLQFNATSFGRPISIGKSSRIRTVARPTVKEGAVSVVDFQREISMSRDYYMRLVCL